MSSGVEAGRLRWCHDYRWRLKPISMNLGCCSTLYHLKRWVFERLLLYEGTVYAFGVYRLKTTPLTDDRPLNLTSLAGPGVDPGVPLHYVHHHRLDSVRSFREYHDLLLHHQYGDNVIMKPL